MTLLSLLSEHLPSWTSVKASLFNYQPFHHGDDRPPQTLNKQVSNFHEGSLQSVIASRNWSLATVNSNYRTHGFFISVVRIIQNPFGQNCFICAWKYESHWHFIIDLIIFWKKKHTHQKVVRRWQKLDKQIWKRQRQPSRRRKHVQRQVTTQTQQSDEAKHLWQHNNHSQLPAASQSLQIISLSRCQNIPLSSLEKQISFLNTETEELKVGNGSWLQSKLFFLKFDFTSTCSQALSFTFIYSVFYCCP